MSEYNEKERKTERKRGIKVIKKIERKKIPNIRKGLKRNKQKKEDYKIRRKGALRIKRGLEKKNSKKLKWISNIYAAFGATPRIQHVTRLM